MTAAKRRSLRLNILMVLLIYIIGGYDEVLGVDDYEQECGVMPRKIQSSCLEFCRRLCGVMPRNEVQS